MTQIRIGALGMAWPLVGPKTHFDSHRVDLPHRIPFDDPVMPAHGEERAHARARETVGALLQSQPADPDEGQAQCLRLNNVRLHGGFKEPAIRIGASEGMNVHRLAVGIDPVRAGQAHQVLVSGQLRHAPPVLEQQTARQACKECVPSTSYAQSMTSISALLRLGVRKGK